jgi:hypothetical protein
MKKMRVGFKFMRFIFFYLGVDWEIRYPIELPSWDWIVASSIEGVATQHAPGSHQAAFDQSKFVDSLIPIVGTGWIKPASIGRHSLRQGHLINPDQE